MKSLRTIIVFCFLVSVCLWSAPFQAPAASPKAIKESSENRFRLKPDGRRKVCLTCHADFEDTLKRAFVHTPVNKPGCTACHNPHTSHHPKQLSARAADLCLDCHRGIVPEGARSVHRVVLERKCDLCHDPHAADHKFNLRTGGNDLCYGCHADKLDAIKKVKFRHAPVETGCVTCHNPHASMKAAALLTEETPGLCGNCHRTDNPDFAKKHMNYPVAGSRCNSCHSVHGSDKAAILHNKVHQPFGNKSCGLCHENAASRNPLALKKQGFELCRGCHGNMVNELFSKNRLHSAVIGKQGCLNCHSPHASSEQGLLLSKPVQVCGACHEDTIDRQNKSQGKHVPVQDGMCVSCHSPHASDNDLLLNESSTISLCAGCHDWVNHSNHPVGDAVIDKRNKNLTVQCLSCHRSHGTEYKKMLPAATVSELCTQCHKEYMR